MALALLDQMRRLPMEVTEATELHQAFLAALLLTLVVAVAERQPQTQPEPEAQVAVVMAQTQRQPQQAELLTPAAVVVAVDLIRQILAQAVPAAPASSFSNTTSALPQSSPSSHRRSGLHLRAR